MKTVLKIIVIVFILFLIVSGGGIFYLNRGLDAGSEVVINELDLSSISDGIYYGSYESGRFSNQVEVEVKDNKIVNISLVDDVLFSKPEERDQFFENVITEQRVNIDVISGSTVTCKAYLKAIEDALSN